MTLTRHIPSNNKSLLEFYFGISSYWEVPQESIISLGSDILHSTGGHFWSPAHVPYLTHGETTYRYICTCVIPAPLGAPFPCPRSPGTPSRWGAAKRSCARCAWRRCDAPWISRHQQTARHSGRRSFTSVSYSAQACSHVPHNTLERNFPGVTGPGTVTPRYSATPLGRMTTSVVWSRAASVTPYHHLRETRTGSGAYSFTPLRGDELRELRTSSSSSL